MSRVHFAVGYSTTLYESIELVLLVHGPSYVLLGHRRGRFSLERNFLATCISQRRCFSVFSCAEEAQLAAVLLARVTEASHVARAGEAMTCGGCLLAARVPAIRLAVVVPSADEERSEAPHAGQLVAR